MKGERMSTRRVFFAMLAVVLSLLSMPAQQPTPSSGSLIIDAKLDDGYWNGVPVRALLPEGDGAPLSMGGEVRIGLRGAYICLAARLPEPGGKILARSAGRNPVWERDALESPPVEDRMEFRFRYTAAGSPERRLSIEVNPWGAYRIERDGRVVADASLPVAATLDPQGWSIEAAVPVNLFGVAAEGNGTDVHFQAVRIRSRRPLAPEFHWVWPGVNSEFRLALPTVSGPPENPPEFRPPALGNNDPALEIGRVAQIPPMPAYLNPSLPSWQDPAWNEVRAFRLPRNEPFPRSPRYPTDIKWMQDGRTLALLVRVEEPEPVAADHGGRDADLSADDHLTFYLATSGSRFLEIMVNSVGAIRDSIGGGLRSLRQSGWNADIKAQTRIENGAWIARIDIPLQQCATALGETGIPSEWRTLISRHRAARPGEPAEISALPPVGSETFNGPLRYRKTLLSPLPPSQVATPGSPHSPAPSTGLDGALAAFDSRVWPALWRRSHAVRNMVRSHQQKRVEEAILAERAAWDAIRTREDWERFRAERLPKLREAAGRFPADRPPLDVRVSAKYEGMGYRQENLVYQSRPGFYVSANLYMPANSSPPVPAMVILHSFHAPKTQGELQDMGQIWARTGCAVLIVERLVQRKPNLRVDQVERRVGDGQFELERDV